MNTLAAALLVVGLIILVAGVAADLFDWLDIPAASTATRLAVALFLASIAAGVAW